jgi:hydroxypyruvate isomerase
VACQTGEVRTHGLRFDVNCSILFTELPLLERPAAAKAAGFEAVEFWWPFDEYVPRDKDADAFVSAIRDAGVELVSLNFHAGDMAAGERGILSDPGKVKEFRANIDVVTEIARRTGCARLNAPYGNRITGADPAEQDAVALENLTLAARAAATAGATVLVEAINSVDVPAFPIDTSAKAVAVINRVPAGNAGFLADLYHLGMMGEDLTRTLTRHLELIAHVQVADVPGRGAPGTGTLDFEPLFAQLAARGYTGSVGLEYAPSDPADSSASFGWMRTLQPGQTSGCGVREFPGGQSGDTLARCLPTRHEPVTRWSSSPLA